MSHPHAPAEQAERPTPPVTQHRQPLRASRDGQAVVYLPVGSLEWAVLDADDADRLDLRRENLRLRRRAESPRSPAEAGAGGAGGAGGAA